MPIRINLLAEAQALEDFRRRDPVKRAIWAGLFLVFLMLAWCSSLQLKAMIAKGQLARIEGEISTRTNEYGTALDNQRKLAEATRKLDALQQLTTNRLLYGTLLNALQHSTVDNVQVRRFQVEQTYATTAAVKPKTNAHHRIILGKPATATEKIVLRIDAKDSGPNPGDQVNKFKQALTNCPYFHAVLGKTNEVRLTNLSPPQQNNDSKPYVLFSLECRYPEVTR